MSKLTLEMPLVSKCSAAGCGYNLNQSCHAKAITIGDIINPECDTFFKSKVHSKDIKRIAGVGACKVQGCKNNIDFECTANAVDVGMVNESIKCLTYSAR